MSKENKSNPDREHSIPLPSFSELRGRQSVRATFKLTEKSIDAISIVALQLGIKQKSLFDHLIDDAKSLDFIAKEIESDRFVALNRIQKTFVLSRKTLSCLEEASKKFGAPRDALVEYSIKRLLPIINEERARHRKRKEILNEIGRYLNDGEEILEKTETLLGKNDPVYEKFKTTIKAARNIKKEIESFVEKGEIIEDF